MSFNGFQPGAVVYTQSFGSRPEGVEVPHLDVRAPTSQDVQFSLGKLWVDTVGNAVYALTSQSSTGGVLTSNWALVGIVGGALNTLTASSGGALAPTGGTINILGTASQVTTAGAGSTITISLPAAIIAPGSITSTTAITSGTSITATIGDITATNGNVIINGAGKQLRVHGGAVTDFIGTGTLALGTQAIANTNIAATDRIFLSRTAVNASTTLGELTYTINAGVSFTVTSVIIGTPGSPQTGDLSSYSYHIVRQV